MVCGVSGGAFKNSSVQTTGSVFVPEDIFLTFMFVSGVLKNSSNSLLPDLTESTTFSFGAARQLKSGSVMDILGMQGIFL
jgi:hypothetical protein